MENNYFIDTNIIVKYYERASLLIREFGVNRDMGMKPGDSLQIVAYEDFSRYQSDLTFVTHDAQLKNILEQLNLKCMDPIQSL